MLGKVAEVIQHFGEGLGGGGRADSKAPPTLKRINLSHLELFLSNNLQRPLKI